MKESKHDKEQMKQMIQLSIFISEKQKNKIQD